MKPSKKTTVSKKPNAKSTLSSLDGEIITVPSGSFRKRKAAKKVVDALGIERLSIPKVNLIKVVKRKPKFELGEVVRFIQSNTAAQVIEINHRIDGMITYGIAFRRAYSDNFEFISALEVCLEKVRKN